MKALPVASAEGDVLGASIGVRPIGRSLPRIGLARVRALRRVGVFGVWLIVYLGIGSYINLVLHVMHGDAYSRVTNASYVLFSRDPHLAAIGFVWPPLPSLFELVLLPFKAVWPPMVETGYAAIIMSVVFMAAAVDQLDRTIRDLGVAPFVRRALVVSFALHPMILFYAVIGTAEAPTLFFLILVVRQLARWIVNPTVGALVFAGAGLAGAYLTRSEAAVAAPAAGFLVAGIIVLRSHGTWMERATAAAADAAILLAPFAAAFVGWAFASWIIVGTPFAQFSSIYGNSSQVRILVAEGFHEFTLPLAQKMGLVFDRLLALYLVAPFAVAAAVVMAWRRRDPRVVAVLGVLGPALGFMVVGYLVGTLAEWLRYFILLIPLAHLSLALAASDAVPPMAARRPDPGFAVGRGRRSRLAAGGLAVAAALAVLPVATLGIMNPRIAAEEARDVPGLVGLDPRGPGRNGGLSTLTTEANVAAYLDSRDLPRGSVLLDVFKGYGIVGQSRRPDQFVITSDKDFQAVLSDPVTFHVQYILAPDLDGNGALDAINRAYPSLALRSDGFARLEERFESIGTSGRWSLYRLAGAAADQ